MTTSKVVKSEFGKIDKKDFWKSLVMAGLTGIFTAAVELITTGFSFDLDTLAYLIGGALSGMGAYLSKNSLTNSEDKFLKKEVKKATKALKAASKVKRLSKRRKK